MVRVENINKKFGELQILKNISMEIPQSKVACIVGKSGAGKSTLLQIVGTLLQPDSGKVFINSNEITHLSERKLATFRNQEIGFVFQFHHLLPEFTAIENVMMPALIAGVKMSKAFEKAKSLLSFMNLSHRTEHKPATLSGGEQQRVAVARALINNPKVILADEPTGNLDKQFAQEIHELFFKLKNENEQTFLIVTHNQELASMADICIQMDQGIIVSA